MLTNYNVFRAALGSNPIIVLDTNALIDLYYFSSETHQRSIENLLSVKGNLWLSNQVKVEFERNHKTEHQNSFKKYDNLSKEINEAIKKYSKENKTIFREIDKYHFPKSSELNSDIAAKIAEIEELCMTYKQSLKDEVLTKKELLKKDRVRELIDIIESEGNIGDEYLVHELLKIYIEGEQRYRYHIPPGYLDVEKDKKDSSGTKKFGDLIIWKQVIDKAKHSQRDIIFISDDRKPDWWDKSNDEPRKELMQEFKHMANQDIYFSKLGDFIVNLSRMNNQYYIATHIDLCKEDIVNDYTRDTDMQFSDKIDDALKDRFDDDIKEEVIDYLSREYEIEVDEVDLSTIVYRGESSIYVDVTEDDNYLSYYVTYELEMYIKVPSLSYHDELLRLDLDIDIRLDADFELNDEELDIEIDNFDIESVSINFFHSDIDEEEICISCRSCYGSSFHNSGGKLCSSCYSDTSEFGICSKCGDIYEQGKLYDGQYCYRCANE